MCERERAQLCKATLKFDNTVCFAIILHYIVYMFLKVGSLYLPLTVTAAEQSMFFFTNVMQYCKIFKAILQNRNIDCSGTWVWLRVLQWGSRNRLRFRHITFSGTHPLDRSLLSHTHNGTAATQSSSSSSWQTGWGSAAVNNRPRWMTAFGVDEDIRQLRRSLLNIWR